MHSAVSNQNKIGHLIVDNRKKESTTSNLTSTIDFLENNRSLNVNIFTKSSTYTQHEQLDAICLWLETCLYPTVCMSNVNTLNKLKDQVHALEFSIKRLQSEIVRCCSRNLKIYTKSSKRIVTCVLCEKDVLIAHSHNFWDSLQTHIHFEEQFVNYSLNKSKFNSSDSDGISLANSKEFDSELLMHSKMTSENHNTFRFNFKVEESENNNLKMEQVATAPQSSSEVQLNNLEYCDEVKNKLYPNKYLQLTYPLHILQACDLSKKILCLLCISEMDYNERIIKGHLSGKKHTCNLTGPYFKNLNTYHSFWLLQTPELQLHQQYFTPLAANYFNCSLCSKIVSIDKTIDHLKNKYHLFNLDKQLKFMEKLVNEKHYKNLQQNFENGEQSSDVSKNSKELKTKIVEHNLSQSLPESPETFLDSLENRFEEHKNHLNVYLQCVHCTCCETQLELDTTIVKTHLLTEEHLRRSGISKKKHSYICDICNIILRTEKHWMAHLSSSLHSHKFHKLGPVQKAKLTEYECQCKSVIFGDELSIKRHLNFFQNRFKPKTIVLSTEVKNIFNSSQNIEIEMNRLMQGAKELLNTEESMMKCCSAFESALTDVYPECKAYPFGSRVTGLGNQSSDLDVFVDVGNMYAGNHYQSSICQKKIIKKVKEAFYKKKNQFIHINAIPTARTPIIQVYHPATGIDCDLSFRHGLSVENTKFLKLCIELEQSTQPLILLVKQWAKIEELNTKITTYALAMMVIFHLQINKHLLSVEELKKYNRQSISIDGWDTIEYTLSAEEMKKLVQPCNLTIKENLKAFFNYYAKFDFSTQVVCPLLGNTINKSEFLKTENGSCLPDAMRSYKQKLKCDRQPEWFRANAEMCIQDPFDLSHNLTKACQLSFVTEFKTMCNLTANLMDAN